MQEYGLKIFYTGVGLLVLVVLLNVRSLAIYKGTRAYWTFGFGLFKYSLEFKPELKKPLKNHKFVNVVKIVIYYLGCAVSFFGKCLYLGIYSAYSYRQLNGTY